jgi:hypothetical protein
MVQMLFQIPIEDLTLIKIRYLIALDFFVWFIGGALAEAGKYLTSQGM